MKAWVNGHSIPRGELSPENLPAQSADKLGMYSYCGVRTDSDAWYDLNLVYYDVAGAMMRVTWSFSIYESYHLRRRIRRIMAWLEQKLGVRRIA